MYPKVTKVIKKYQQSPKITKKYQKVPTSNNNYQKVPKSTKKYQKVQKSTRNNPKTTAFIRTDNRVFCLYSLVYPHRWPSLSTETNDLSAQITVCIRTDNFVYPHGQPCLSARTTFFICTVFIHTDKPLNSSLTIGNYDSNLTTVTLQ